jgi:serine phosphatase RsbU (regulator of sigma subunit)/anti-sigma regulatory factor (Ser/Thr protein kinase)
MRDISSRKQNEEKLLAAHSELERLYQHLNQEYEIAEKIFSNVVQKNIEADRDIKYFLSPKETTGSDLFLTASGVPGVKLILLGDFTGHGLSAAIGAIPVSSIFHAMAARGNSLRKIARQINCHLNTILPTGLFFCACMVEWDDVHHIARIMNFGLPMALVVSAAGVIKTRIHSQHLPLGILPDIDREYRYVEVHLQNDDRIYLFTNGIIDVRNNSGEPYGQERLEQLLTQSFIPDQRFDAICHSITAFRGDTPQLDDMAIAELKCGASTEDHPTEKIVSAAQQLPAMLSLSFMLHPGAMQAVNLIESITELLIGTHVGARNQKQNIFLILSELYSNALEHGILLMDSSLKNEPNGFEKYFETRAKRLADLNTGWIKIDMELSVQDMNGRIVLHIEDSGHGFDYQLIPMTQPDFSTFGGRGLFLVRSLCKDVVIEGNGNKITAVFEW